ncbi:MAG: PTH1 family peptidyl-tRNA hydrolase [Chlamydiales bacterium]|jgi:PTH1 family peptidyl-tRNA hydrolase
MRLVIGLGNPGPQYQGTRHNVGFDILDHLADREGSLFNSARHLDGYSGPRGFSFAYIDKLDALLVKPETFMNRSGEVVAPVARFLQEADAPQLDQLLVVYDDLDLDPGRLRIRPHGGAGGHNGMRSIIDHLGSDRFPRLRVGVGRPGTDAARYVLERFSEKQQVEIEISVAEAADAILDWLTTGDLEGCMTRFHSRWNQGPND